MKKTIIIGIVLIALSACKKSVTKTHPELVGKWYYVNWCVVENGNSKSLTVNTKGKGEFSSYNYNTGGGDSFIGKVKTKDEELYIDGNFVFNIIEVVDTSGYIHNPNPPSLCSNDSIFVSGLLRVTTESGHNQLYRRN